MDTEDQEKLDSIARRMAEKGGISESSAHRLLRQVLFQEDIRDRYVRTEVGFVALGLTVFVPRPLRVDSPETRAHTEEMLKRYEQGPYRNQPKPRVITEENLAECQAEMKQMEFRTTPVVDRPNHYRWIVSVADEEAPEVLRIWDRYLRAMYEVNIAVLRDRDDEGVSPRSSAEKWRDQERVRLARIEAEREKEIWDRERRRHWPFHVVHPAGGAETVKDGSHVDGQTAEREEDTPTAPS